MDTDFEIRAKPKLRLGRAAEGLSLVYGINTAPVRDDGFVTRVLSQMFYRPVLVLFGIVDPQRRQLRFGGTRGDGVEEARHNHVAVVLPWCDEEKR